MSSRCARGRVLVAGTAVALALGVAGAQAAGSPAVGRGAGAPPPTAYLGPLQAHQAKLSELRHQIDRLRALGAPATAEAASVRADAIRKAGSAYLSEARAFSKTVASFVRGDTRRGLDIEVDTIRATIGQVLATVDAYRPLSGAVVQKPTAQTPSALAQMLRSALGEQIARRIPNKLVAEGVNKMLAGASFREAVQDALAQARQSAYARVDSQVRSVTGLGLRDLRDLGRAIRLRANQEIDRQFTRLLVRVTGNGLVIELIRQFALPWLKARLTALMRPHLTLDQRVTRSIKSLRAAAKALDVLPTNARLTTVRARWRDAQASLAATRVLVADLKRAGREALLTKKSGELGEYGVALKSVEQAMRRAEIRFLLHKENLVQTLAVDRSELNGMLGELAFLVRHVVVPRPSPQASLEAELTRGSWTFGRVNGAVLCTITLTKTPGKYGAYVLRACHPNESYWKLEGRTLYFLHADGKRTSRLTRINVDYWRGPYLGHPDLPADGTIHYIRR